MAETHSQPCWIMSQGVLEKSGVFKACKVHSGKIKIVPIGQKLHFWHILNAHQRENLGMDWCQIWMGLHIKVELGKLRRKLPQSELRELSLKTAKKLKGAKENCWCVILWPWYFFTTIIWGKKKKEKRDCFRAFRASYLSHDGLDFLEASPRSVGTL